MQFADQITQDATGQAVPFLDNNGNRYAGSNDPGYSYGSPHVTLIQNCAWPPPAGADQTGYSQILFTTEPGDTSWPGELSTFAQVDGVDTRCETITAVYTGEHTGSSWSDKVTVSHDQLALAEPNDTIGGTAIPGEAPGEGPNLTKWAYTMAYKIIPGEMAILRPDADTLSSATCGG